MSETFDFRGGGKRIRISDIDSNADTVVRAGAPVEDFGAHSIRHAVTGVEATPTSTMTVLFVLANPKNVGVEQLSLDEEMNAITRRVRQAPHGELVEFEFAFAPRVSEFMDALTRHRPRILHFSGHGSDAALMLVNDDGNAAEASTEAVTSAIAASSEHLCGVVFNSCDSRGQAEAAVAHVDFAIGMKEPIGDEAAQSFAAGFYAALAAGDSVERAFDKARSGLLLDGIAEENTPQLSTRAGLAAGALVLVGPHATIP